MIGFFIACWFGKIEKRNILGKLNSNDTLYLIVIKDVWDRIVSGSKVVEYREVTDYWTKRILNRDYKYMRITNGYGNKTRPYRLYKYVGATRVMVGDTQHYSIPISKELIIESRDYVNDNTICHYSGLPSTSSYTER